MINNKKISLIIPCKNEEKALSAMLKKAPSCVDEIIIVDNNSIDKTGLIGKSFNAKVIKENREINGVGYGFSHKRGLEEATGDIIIAMDGDDTYPITKIEEVVSYMEKVNADFVSCSRFPLSNRKAVSFIRQLGIKILNLEVLILYKYRIKDILSGMWVLRKNCVKKLSLQNGDWNLSPEIKLSALKNPDIVFSECHIDHKIRENERSKQRLFKTGLSHLFYILKRRMTVDRINH